MILLPKRTSLQRPEPCPHWEDCQGVTAAATPARRPTELPFKWVSRQGSQGQNDWEKQYIALGGQARVTRVTPFCEIYEHHHRLENVAFLTAL